ncbi:non-canonical purine NTP pyrophosphatase [Psychrobacter sp.]|uniref:non-canonical purine NTP pyrophosphatase n=1 Tax=Psychrobacter sp. TaxID=56811 RepID=UPI0025D3E5DC|nr:non-canonical purine NTP pyrophosphatase [Psychrobacter sp.]
MSDPTIVATSQIAQLTSAKCYVLASNNKGKLAEFQRLFAQADLDIVIVPQGQLNISDAVEDGLSFVENAIIKARHASQMSGLPAIADDSGLCVPVLGNAPGIYSARYAGEHGNDAKNNAKLIESLAPFRKEQPTIHSSNQSNSRSNSQSNRQSKSLPIKGYFVCVLAMVRHADDPLPIIAQGVWHGEILASPLGDNGFGYDPLFWLPDLQQTAAQLDPTLKNQISHRGLAMQNLLQQL